jgi:predicted nucleotidyltransferase
MDRAETIAACAAFLAARPDIELALVYGSFAADRVAAHSDLDLAVAARLPLALSDKLSLAAELGMITGREIDLVDLRKVEGLILHRILTRGLVIKRSPSLLAALSIKALSFADDWLPYQRRIRRAKNERFAHGS